MQRLAAIDNTQLLHQFDAAGNTRIACFGVGLFDQLVGGLVVAVEVVVPAEHGGIDKFLHQGGFVLHQLGACLYSRAVGAEAVVRQQVHHRVETSLRLDADRFADRITLLHGLLVGQKRPHIEYIRFQVFVLEAMFGFHPLPKAELAVFADKGGRRTRQVVEFVVALAWVGEDGLRVFLENRRHHDRRHAVLHMIKTLQQVTRHQEVKLAGGQQRAAVHLWATLLNLYIQAHAFVGAIGQRLVETAVARLGLPIGGKDHLFLRKTAGGAAQCRTKSNCLDGKS